MGDLFIFYLSLVTDTSCGSLLVYGYIGPTRTSKKVSKKKTKLCGWEPIKLYRVFGYYVSFSGGVFFDNNKH